MDSYRTNTDATQAAWHRGAELRHAGHPARVGGREARGYGRPARTACLRIEAGRLLAPELRGAVVALGNFDGVHLGHQAVVGRAVAMARARGVAAIVATFDPHPVRHFRPGSAPFRLTTLEQRQRMLHAAGADAMMVFAFNGALAEVTPEDFVHRWLAGTGAVVTGRAFRFGHRRAGTVDVLADLTAERGMACDAVGAVTAGGEAVSSSRIRRALAEGDCETAAALLSRPFAIAGPLRGDGAAAWVPLGGYLRPLAGAYAARLRLPDGGRVPCTASFAAGADAMRLQGPVWPAGICGQAVEVDILRRLACAMQAGGDGADCWP